MTPQFDNDSRKSNHSLRLAIAFAVATGLGTGILTARQVRAATDKPAVITIDNFTFGPANLTVPAGTTVTWTNHDDIPHSIVATDKAFRSAALDTNDSYTFTFKTAGTFAYFCGLHPHMTGKVIVTP
ncbi:MAG: cupredoxin family copper-binding protein [Rhizobiales bacterium]|nr:cupredoxin family copper-binding protein [Hyphomicrobiales bacterium]MBN9012676.1 cupredoxin family copper-binding protein [Hyphomicrobiales bacterium]